jgi:hypothetical protein
MIVLSVLILLIIVMSSICFYYFKIYKKNKSDEDKITDNQNIRTNCLKKVQNYMQGKWLAENFDPDFNYDLELILNGKQFIYRVYDKSSGARALHEESKGDWVLVTGNNPSLKLKFNIIGDSILSVLKDNPRPYITKSIISYDIKKNEVEFKIDYADKEGVSCKENMYEVVILDDKLYKVP